MGDAYPAGGGLSYQLGLVYSGNVWDYELVRDVTGYDYLKAVPRRLSNAGLGWRVSLGELDMGYLSPDGAAHPFSSSLHSGGPSATGFSYTIDSTYLRYNTNVSPRVLEFPDGTRRYFDAASGKLTKIDDRFGNSLSITYPVSATYSGIKDWKLTDSQGRVHWIYFKPAPALAGVYNQGVVDRIVVTAFNGTSATYTFAYSATKITRGLTDPALTCATATTTETVPLLTSVTQPDGSKYSFAYDPGPTLSSCETVGLGVTTSLSGHLVRMTLPTLGALEWTWSYYYFPQQSERFVPLPVEPQSVFGLTPFSRSVGVVERRMVKADGGLQGMWTYQQGLNSSQTPIREGTTTVTDPLGHRTVHYFSVYACQPHITGCPSEDPDPSGWSFNEYGLPFTRNAADATGTRFLSSEIRSGSSTVLRRTYLRYENGGPGFNPRVASSRTVFVDDGGIYADDNHSDFDGLGHYRRVATAGTFAAGNVRETYTNFNPGSCATCTPATSAPWVLETYSRQDRIEAGVTARTEACFESATGFLLRTRTLKTGTTQGATDLVTRFSRDAAGNVTAQESFGGDTQSLGTGGLCGLALPTAKYRVDHTYHHGALRTSQYSGQPFKSADLDRDFETGRVKTSRDVAGLSTSYEYDAMGRLTYVKPAQEGWTQYLYGNASGTSTPAKVFINRRTNGGGTVLAYEEVHFDPFGRVAVERKKMAGGTTSDRKTFYDASGNVASKTEWGTTAATSLLGYDPFGRPKTIRPPDGSVHDVTLAYKGTRQVTRTVKIGTGWNGTAVTETTATTTEVYDRQGRLYQVFEPANADGSSSTTTYAYDVGGRLKQVTHTAKNSGGSNTTQNRYFTYDNRGFLTSETHPEKGASGNGSMTYSSYDARGHAGRVVDGPSDLTFTYDGAERVTQVRETGTGGRVLKALTYATTNATGDHRLGKLQVARGYNHVVIGTTPYTVELAETYTYGGKQGRVSKRDTVTFVNGGAGESFTQSWVWNDLGERASTTYPKCTHAGCTATTTRTVTPTYAHGWLTSVSGYASSITYHPNGQVNQVTHVNDPANTATWVTDTYSKDPYNQLRPNKIDAKLGTTILWNSGVHAYDGAGNMTKAGNAYFLYDPVSRVKSGRLYLGPGAGGTEVTFDHAYDGFGNLVSLTANGVQRNTPTATTTNRLTGSVAYDAAGNLTYWNGASYSYDRLNQMWRMANGTEDWLYLYTADGERLWSFKVAANLSRWTLRDLDGKVLREYQNAGGTWTIQRDYVYRGSQLLSAHTADASPKDRIQFHLDHLGTPRAITNKNGARIAYHVYYPFGEEATSFSQDTERMKFTGHERDLANTASAADDLDYMHARFYSPHTGRFLSTDPKELRNPLRGPQRWNMYTYALNNPLQYVDLSGESPVKYLVKGVAGTYRYAKRSVAVRRAREAGHAVTVRGPGASQEARRIAREAHPDKKIVRHDAHGEGQLPHYQPKSGGKGHVHYDAESLVAIGAGLGGAVAARVEAATGSETLGAAAGVAVDFFNPISDINEAANFLQEVGDDIIGAVYDVDLQDEEPEEDEETPPPV
ncbi:MAG TPA: RHS repeat-associated core domain-containing protein [Thermoanaerobaculia bacterium]|nr:RHS repeat-associated core domain-containing protein [Thermoanaerobaculia bacterium]